MRRIGWDPNAAVRDSLTNKRDFCPPSCAMYVPCCSIRAVSTAQAKPDQHPEQTQIEQRPDFGNIAKRQTRPSPTQSTFSVDGALPGRRCAILAGSMHSPRLAGQIGGARTEQGRGGGDVRSGRLREPTSTGRAWTTARRGTLGRRCCSARPVWSGARPIMTRRLLGCGLAPTDPLHALPGRRTGGFSF